jgi:hypothetical protein
LLALSVFPAQNLVGATEDLGYLIMISAAHLETATLFASALAGIALFHANGTDKLVVVFSHSADVE